MSFKPTRRMFLLGAGGAALAIPFLPSLLSPREAFAQTHPTLKRYIHFATPHGAIWQANMQPPASTVTEMRPYADRMIKRGDLAPTYGTDTVISPVLTAPATALTPALVRKMNVLHGLDIPFYIGHHTGGHLGNYARNDGNGSDGQIVQAHPKRTIDQLMAWSADFYTDLSNTRLRAMTSGRLSWDWSDPIAQTGVIQQVSGNVGNAQQLFDDVMGTVASGTHRAPTTDQILASYQRLRNGTSRLSAEDRRRLDDHIARIVELRRQLTTIPMCGAAMRPASNAPMAADYGYNPAAQVARWQQNNDVIAAAIACGATRIGVVSADDTFSNYRGDWHQEIAHKAHLPTGVEQTTIMSAHNLFFKNVFLDLAQKLDAIDDGGGRTVLDNTLLVWTQESGPYTHENYSAPVITFGGAAGALRTGSYVDYRNTGITGNHGGYQGSTEVTYAGLLYSQFLATVLTVMGIPTARWAEPANAPGSTPGSTMLTDPGGGYGLRYIADAAKYPASVQMNNSDPLPYLTP